MKICVINQIDFPPKLLSVRKPGLQFCERFDIIAPSCYVAVDSYHDEPLLYTTPNLYTKEHVMKKGIHPEYMECHVSCACGNSFTVLSNKPEMRIDICNACHPFFTGSQKIVDATGRVEKFKNKYKLGK